MIRYAITDSHCVESDPEATRRSLLEQVQRWVDEGIEFVQLREKQLAAGTLFGLARAMVRLAAGSQTRLLVNGRVDVALAAGADGVHLPASPGQLRPEQVRTLFAADDRRPVVSVSCHTIDEVRQACESGADLLLFGPVFEKCVGGQVVVPGLELASLRKAAAVAGKGPCRVPVLALGGVTRERVAECLAEGAAGIAGIRLFR